MLGWSHCPKDGVALIEMRRGHLSDEKLRPIGTGARVGHGHPAGHIEVEAGIEFIGETCIPGRRFPLRSDRRPES